MALYGFNINRIIAVTFIFITLSSSLVKSQTKDLNSQDYDNFTKDNLLFMLTICNFKDTKCKKLKETYEAVYEKFKRENNLEIKFPFINEENLTDRIMSKYIYEGIPVTYYVNLSHSNKEVYFGLRDLNSIYEFLKYKLIIPEENLFEAKDEKEAIEKINLTKEKRALVIIGDLNTYPHYNFNLIQKAGRKSGFENVVHIKNYEILEKYEVVHFDLAIYDQKFKYQSNNDFKTNSDEELLTSDNNEINFYRLKINKDKKYEADKLSRLILLADYNKNNTNLFSNFDDKNFELALNHGVPTIFYLYSDKSEQLNQYIEEDLKKAAKNYQNEFIFTKGSINHKIIKSLKIVKHYDIIKSDLPMILITSKPEEYFHQFSLRDHETYNDDVDKFILKKSKLNLFTEKFLKNYKSRNNIEEGDEITFSSEIIETYIQKIKENIVKKNTHFTLNENFELNGENFIGSVTDTIEKDESILVLIICPKGSKKYARIRSRIERVFNIIYKANNEKILFDEFDPFLNEISFINYNYFPTIAVISKSDSPNSWKVNIHNGKLTTNAITRFIQSSIKEYVTELPLENEAEVTKFEKENPLYPMHKIRYEGKLLSDRVVTDMVNVGLKRRWYSLKKNKRILNKGQLKNLEYPNVYEEDEDITEDLEIIDDVIESHLHHFEKEPQNVQQVKDDL